MKGKHIIGILFVGFLVLQLRQKRGATSGIERESGAILLPSVESSPNDWWQNEMTMKW